MMVRSPCCDKMNVKKGVWTPEEDEKMMAYVSKHGTGNWTAVPKKAGLRRCGKSCRLRWNNYIRLDLKHDNFTPQEEELIIKLHGAIGTRWSIIAQQLPGRTDNDVKNYWNSKLRKKLQDMGIDPITHKPYSQIVNDYGNIGGLRKFGHGRIGSLNKDLKNAFTQIQTNPQEQLVHFSYNNSYMMAPSPSAPATINHHQAVSQSTDLLDQLQAIQMFTGTPTPSRNKNIERTTMSPPHRSGFFVLSPTSSSSSSTCSGTNASLQGLSWQDYLLDNVFVPNNVSDNQMAEYFDGNGINNNSNLIIEEKNQPQSLQHSNNENILNHESGSHGFGPSTCNPHTSFLDRMLACESELMLLEFPSLLED